MLKDNSYLSSKNDTYGDFQVCFKNDRTVGSYGVWVGDNPFNFVVPITLCQIILASLISRALYYLLRPLHTPKFICCVLGGVLLGPTFLGRNRVYMDTLFPMKQASILTIMSKIGSAYFIFLNALKTDITTTLRAAKRCWRFCVIPFFTSYFITVLLLGLYDPHGKKKAPSLDSNNADSIYSIPNVFTVSSFAVVADALTELNLLTTELGQIALSSAMVSELLQWAVITIQFTSTERFILSVWFFSCCFIFLLSFFFIVRPVTRTIIRRTPIGKPVSETYVVMMLLGVLVTAGLSDSLGLYFAIGPILFGLVTPSGPPLATTLIDRTEFVVSELLMPFFFIYIGVTTDVDGIGGNWKIFLGFQGILFVGFMAKIIACVLIAPTYNIRPKHGLVLGLILNIKGIMELIFFSRLKKMTIINVEVYSQMVLYVVMMTGICIPFIKGLYKNRTRVLKTSSMHEKQLRMIHNAPENSEFSIISCVHNDGNVRSMIGLLEAFNPTPKSPLYVHVIHLTELLGKSTPILLPINMQNTKSLSASYPNSNHILRAFENYSQNSKGPVTILSYINVAPYDSMHEAICNLSQDKSVHFLITPFHENDQSLVANNHISTSIRDMNSNFQACVPCTVGILVDRYSRLSLSTSKLSFQIAIFFVGGPDDREALALGIRMLERPNTSVTLFCFVIDNNNSRDVKYEVNEEEENLENTLELDESLIDEFKAKKINSDNINVCHEIVVEDCIQAIEAIRGLENDDYDLVMAGKRHNLGDLTDEEMSNFMDNANQLGVFGDMLASTEFCNGRVPVLVLQCGEKQLNKFEKVGSGDITLF